jgi:hypothetical protein
MELKKLLVGLYSEREKLERVIASLEELRDSLFPDYAGGGVKRRGRRSMPAAERLEVSDRMKKYWAKRRRAAAAGGSGA